MSSIFDKHELEISKFYDEMKKVMKSHEERYVNLINELNKKDSITTEINKDFDEFMASIFPEFKEFKDNIQPFDNKSVDFMYDLNKKEFVDVFDLPDRKIIRRYSSPYYYGEIRNNGNYGIRLLTNKHTFLHFFSNNGTTNSYRQIDQRCSKSSQNMFFVIDNYMNIYFPYLRLYVLKNYSKFNLFSFWGSGDDLDLKNKIGCFYGESANDLACNMSNMTNFQASEDVRKKSVDENLPSFLELYKYDEILDKIKQYRILSQKFSEFLQKNPENNTKNEENLKLKDEQIGMMNEEILALKLKLKEKNNEIDSMKCELKRNKSLISKVSLKF